MAKSDISNQKEVKKNRKKHAFSLSFQNTVMNLKNQEAIQGLPSLTSALERNYTTKRYDGLTRQKRIKEIVSSAKNLAVSEQKEHIHSVHMDVYRCT